jgi:hypothetical protein
VRQRWQCHKITSDHRLFLFTPPTFDLALCRQSILYRFEMLMEHESHRSLAGGVSIEGTGLMFRDALVQAAVRRADVV